MSLGPAGDERGGAYQRGQKQRVFSLFKDVPHCEGESLTLFCLRLEHRGSGSNICA